MITVGLVAGIDEVHGQMQPDQISAIERALIATAEVVAASVRSGPVHSSFEQRLRRVTAAALNHVPGADGVGLTMGDAKDRLTSYGQTGSDVQELDRLQADLGEGPCVDALRLGASEPIEVADFVQEAERWPRFAPEAVSLGFRSSLSLGLAAQEKARGSVNIYSRTTRAFDDTARMIAAGFATQAGIVVRGARQVVQMEQAIESRDVIGQAKGILMERYRIDDVEAFDRLVRASQDSNVKLVDVARWLVGDLEQGAARKVEDLPASDSA